MTRHEMLDLRTSLPIARSESRASGPEPVRLHEFFETQVRTRPDQIALECNGVSLTYAELDNNANQIANYLRARGVGPNGLVGLYYRKSWRLYAAMLGVLKAGAGYVPIDPKFPVKRIEDIFLDAGVKTVLTEDPLGREIEGKIHADLIFTDRQAEDIDACVPPISPAPERPNPDGICYVIYTSGSTGRPKGVMIEHRNAVNFVNALRTTYRLTDADRVYQGFSTAFDASVEEIWAAFSLGGTLVAPTDEIARSPIDAAEFITSRRISFFSTVPTFLAMIEGDLPTVKVLVLGGEACSPDLVTRWTRNGRRMLNTYGPTEATVVATLAECVAGEPVSIGVPLPGYETYVLDDQMRLVPAGEIGELYIGGTSVARGYMNSPELTAERFIPHPFREFDRLYRTHDLVRPMRDGSLQFVGRIDGQIKIRGYRIELSEIEAVLIEHPMVRAAAVTVFERNGMKELAAYIIVSQAAGELDRKDLTAHLSARMPEHMMPKFLDVVSELPAMNSGKVDRKLLPAPATLLIGDDRTVCLPETDTERRMALVWEQCFEITPVSVLDDFFLDLGGHSLLAAKAVTSMRAAFESLHISVRELYQHRTIRALAAHLETIGIADSKSTDSNKQGEDAPHVSTLMRWTCVALQFASLLLYYGVLTTPTVLSIAILERVLAGELDWDRAFALLTMMTLAVWPTWLFLSIAIKWLVIGRYRPGRYPVWGFYYFRWWFVSLFQRLSWCWIFAGTPLMSLYYRAMGARVEDNCVIGTAHCSIFDLVTIGRDTSIGGDTHLLGYRVEKGGLILGEVNIGRNCFIGMHSSIGLDVIMYDEAKLDDMSMLPDRSIVRTGEGWRGSPASIAAVDAPEPKHDSVSLRPVLFGFLHLGLIYAMGYLLIISAAPAIAMVAYALWSGGPWVGILAAFASVPVSLLWFLALVVATKRLIIGRIRPGSFPLHSAAYLRIWFMNYLLQNMREIVMPLYATLYFPAFLRLLGAKIEPGAEISTIMHITPDQLIIDGGSFLADACIVGGHRVHNGLIEVAPTSIGRRSFIGNSAFIPGGARIGDDCLIGVMSTPPANQTATQDGTQWLGSPGFQLPRVQQNYCFSPEQISQPTKRLVRQRACFDAVRILLPGFMSAAIIIAFIGMVWMSVTSLPLWATMLMTPIAAFALSFVSMLSVAAVKRILIGRFTPIIKPLWCHYVWRNEIVNAVYETIGATAMAPLLGTPLIAIYLRLMGCKIGRWVFLETTLFSEFDLVDIGDHAALNLGSNIQTHLFEDRVMKSDYLRIGEHCTVGNMAVALYSTEMQRGSSIGPLSVLLKGEILPPSTHWQGIPSQPVTSAPGAPSRASIRNEPNQKIAA